MLNVKQVVYNTEGYDDSGNHQTCDLYIGDHEIPIHITKGDDGFSWYDKNRVKCSYNNYKSGKLDQRWICWFGSDGHSGASPNFYHDFDPYINKSLDKVVEHVVKKYKKALKQDIVALQNIFDKLKEEK